MVELCIEVLSNVNEVPPAQGLIFVLFCIGNP